MKRITAQFAVLVIFIGGCKDQPDPLAIRSVPLLQASGGVRFNGVLRDRDRTPVPNQRVVLNGTGPDQSVTTAADGSFSISVAPDNYSLGVQGGRSLGAAGGNANIPDRYDLFGPSITLSADQTQDLTLQNVFLQVTVVDQLGGNPVPDASITVPCFDTQFELFAGGVTNGGACGDGATTDATGVARVILLPASPTVSVTVVVTPPASTGLPQVTKTVVNVVQDVTLTIALTNVLPVTIDVQPGSNLNSIKLSKQGKVTVAILSDAGFAAPSRVARTSLTFGRSGNEASLASCGREGEDVNRDGFADLVCQFYAQKTAFQVGDTQGILRGRTLDQVPIEGRNAVRVLR